MSATKSAEYISCFPEMHVFCVTPGSPADIEFKDRQHLGPGECPVCNEDRREYLRRQNRLCECYDEPCKNGCEYARLIAEIKDPPPGLVFLLDDPEDLPNDHGTADGIESDVYRDMQEYESTRYGDN